MSSLIFNAVVNNISSMLNDGKKEFIIYPFGERGAMVKGILNQFFNIRELIVADNFLCSKNKNIKNVADLPEFIKKYPKSTILITHENPSNYEDVRNQLYKYVPKNRCVEILPKIRDVNKEVIKKLKKAIVKRDSINFDDISAIYKPLHTHSVFYLPLYHIDEIQNNIFVSDNYFSIAQLKSVFMEFRNGIIGKQAAGKLFLDIGANIGNHTLFFSNELNAGLVHSFEPVIQTFRMLNKNIELNNLENKVVLHRNGLGKETTNALVSLNYNVENIGGTNLWLENDGDIEIRRLDDFTFEDKIYFIKIDVEGMELSVLQGGEQTIIKDRPYILLEAWTDEQITSIRAFMKKLDYAYVQINNCDYLFYSE